MAIIGLLKIKKTVLKNLRDELFVINGFCTTHSFKYPRIGNIWETIKDTMRRQGTSYRIYTISALITINTKFLIDLYLHITFGIKIVIISLLGTTEMLSREDSIALLTEYSKGAAWSKHCFAVAGSASRLGYALENRFAIDHHFLWSASLLHDIGRCITHDPILHGIEGYKLMKKLGHEKEAYVCASHILFGLESAEAIQFGLPACDFTPRTIEERLVPLVDFMIENEKPTTLDHRFLSLRRRNADNDFFLGRLDRAQETARSFMMRLSKEIGESVEDLIVTSS